VVPVRIFLGLASIGLASILAASLVLGDWEGSPSGFRPLHAIHAENELGCEDCHDTAGESAVGTDLLLPEKDLCADCHDVDDDDACGDCHLDANDPVGYAPRPEIVQKFSHAAHVDDMECKECHEVGGSLEPVLPDKLDCRECHTTATAQSDCYICHADSEPWRPVSHGTAPGDQNTGGTPGYLAYHAIDGAWNQQTCWGCHTQTDCQDCHAGNNVRPRTHRLNYAFDHSIEARAHEWLCYSCHETTDDCTACHARERVLPDNHSRADWVQFPSGGRHSEDGQFDMENCMACHQQGTTAPTCVPCHGQ